MKNDVTDEVCPECIHQLVTGVACDWQYSQCPFVQKSTDEKQSKMTAFHGEQIATEAEPCFILSAN